MPTPEENQSRDYSRYDQMCTEELEQLLRLDFQAPEEDGFDLEVILYLSDLLARRKGLTDSSAAWEQFQAKYRPYADGHSLYSLEEAPSPPTRHLGWLAMLAAVLAALLLSGIITQTAGVDLLGRITQRTDPSFHSASDDSGSSPTAAADGEDTRQLLSTLQELGMDHRFPVSHLDGFLPGDVNVTRLNTRVSADVTFTRGDRSYTVWVDHFTQPDPNTGTFEKDDTPVEEYEHSGQTFYIFSNLDTLTATTYDGEFMVTVSGMLTREELMTILNAIPSPYFARNRAQVEEDLAQIGQALYSPQIPEGFWAYTSDYNAVPPIYSVDWHEVYLRGEESLTFGLTIYMDSSRATYFKDDGPVEEYEYHGITHYLFGNQGTATAVWMVGDTEYYMWTTDETLDIKELIRSLYASE